MPKSPTTLIPCRILFDALAEGAWNMAVDEALGESAAESGIATLRFYGWSRPTLSLGYFQNYAERLSHTASANCAIVRRSSGGGAIVHDRELTYSLALPCAERAVGDAPELYLAVHTALVAILAEWGVVASVRPAVARSEICTLPTESANPKYPNPAFLCFQRQALGDVLIGGTKIAGSAQRRRRGAILQHGSVLLETSAAAPELPGIRELAGVGISPSELGPRWAACLTPALNLQAFPADFTPVETARSEQLLSEKYGQDTWSRRR